MIPVRPPTALLTGRLPTIPIRSPSVPSHASQTPLFRSPHPSRPAIRLASQWGPRNPRGQPRYSRPRYSRFQKAHGVYQLWQTNPPFRYGIGAVGLGVGTFYYANLERVPISGRLRFNCVPGTFEEQQGKQALQAIAQEYQGKVLPSYHPDSMLVNRVLKRLIPASGMEDLDWEVKVIDDPQQKNAFVLPG